MKRLNRNDQAALAEWEAYVAKVKAGEKPMKAETLRQKQQRVAKALKSFPLFVKEYFSHYAQNEHGEHIETPWFHQREADYVEQTPRTRAVIAWSRDFAKSVLYDLMLLIWRKCNNHSETAMVVLVGETETTAKRLLMPLQAELQFNEKLVSDFGQQMKFGDWSGGDFTTQDGCNFVALGLRQPVRGLRKGARRPTWINVDDIESLLRAKNPERTRETVEWIKRSLLPTMSTGFSRFFVINNLCVKNGIVDTLINENPGWHISLVNALDDKGRPNWPGRFDLKYYEQVKQDIGLKAFMSEFMNQPTNEGGVFNSNWEQWKMPLLDWAQYDALVWACDPSFSTSPMSDYTAIRLWAFRKGGEKMCLDSMVEQRKSLYRMLERWNRAYFDLPVNIQKKIKPIIEGNATQKFIIRNEMEKLRRNKPEVMPLRIIEAKKGEKGDRITTMIPDYENQLVYFNQLKKNNPGMATGNAQLFGWHEKVKHGDDTPDCDEMAWREGERILKDGDGSGFSFSGFFKNRSRG